MNKILEKINDYYTAKLAAHGAISKGVDWNSNESQLIRFQQLSKIFSEEKNFSVNDLGCGYGALFDFLESHYQNINYHGFDISSAMIRTARESHLHRLNAHFYNRAEVFEMADYSVASGIFNVRFEFEETEWFRYVQFILENLHRCSRKGFAFNCLTSYSDAEHMRNDLYYANPMKLFDLCKQQYSKNVALLHDYGLYEFTILVRKS